jgi:hypothetical protein
MELTDLGFPVSYCARELSQVPQDTVLHFSPPAPKSRSPSMLVWEPPPVPSIFVEVLARNGTRWLGEFSGLGGGLSGIFATPNEDVICVVNRGEGYLVDTMHPDRYDLLPVVPVMLVRRVPSRNILFFVDHTRLCALGKDGLLWVTKRVSWDGIKILEVTDRQIRGEGWDAPTDRWIPFSVDVETGHVDGGPDVPH